MRISVNDHAGHPFQVQLSRELARRGHQVMHTYCANVQTPRGVLVKSSKDPVEFHIQGISLDRDFNKYGLVSRWLQERELGDKTAKVIADFSPDVVISANTPLVSQSKLLEATHRHNARFFFWLQDVLSIGISNALRKKLPIAGGLIGSYFNRLEQRLWRESEHIVAITDDFLPYLSRAGVTADRMTAIENWAPLDELPLYDKVNDWSLHHGLADKKCFLYSGTLGLKHNPSFLVELAKTFSDQSDVRVVVISEGQGADFLEESKRTFGLDNLLILDFQPFHVMPKVLATGDVLVALLEADAGAFAVPSKVLTYLCAKRALLLAVPSNNLVARIVQDNEAGLASSSSKTEEFVANALRLMNDHAYREELASRGRQYAEQTFDIGRITDNFENLFANK